MHWWGAWELSKPDERSEVTGPPRRKACSASAHTPLAGFSPVRRSTHSHCRRAARLHPEALLVSVGEEAHSWPPRRCHAQPHPLPEPGPQDL